MGGCPVRSIFWNRCPLHKGLNVSPVVGGEFSVPVLCVLHTWTWCQHTKALDWICLHLIPALKGQSMMKTKRIEKHTRALGCPIADMQRWCPAGLSGFLAPPAAANNVLNQWEKAGADGKKTGQTPLLYLQSLFNCILTTVLHGTKYTWAVSNIWDAIHYSKMTTTEISISEEATFALVFLSKACFISLFGCKMMTFSSVFHQNAGFTHADPSRRFSAGRWKTHSRGVGLDRRAIRKQCEMQKDALQMALLYDFPTRIDKKKHSPFWCCINATHCCVAEKQQKSCSKNEKRGHKKTAGRDSPALVLQGLRSVPTLSVNESWANNTDRIWSQKTSTMLKNRAGRFRGQTLQSCKVKRSTAAQKRNTRFPDCSVNF